MTTPGQHTWSNKGLRRLAVSFAGQEHEGVLGGLLLRLARYLQGDPSVPISVSVPFNSPTQLPDDVRAFTAVFHVVGSPVQYRTDGGNPGGTDPTVPIGTVITLTGQPTIKGFRAVSTTLTTATLAGAYFD